MPARCLVPEPFHVEPHLLGRSLASPARRVVAFLIDGIVLIVPTLAVGVAAAAFSLYLTDRAGFDAVRNLPQLNNKDAAVSRSEGRVLAPLLVRLEAPGLPPAIAAAVDEGDLDRAAELLRNANIEISMKVVEESADQPLRPGFIRLPVERLIPARIRAIALLGVPALYFAAFARSKRGATIGKRLLRIRVVRLDGERLSWLEALERFVGYVHIPATGFISLLDFWRDPNRRLPHDRTVHTAVLVATREVRRAVARQG